MSFFSHQESDQYIYDLLIVHHQHINISTKSRTGAFGFDCVLGGVSVSCSDVGQHLLLSASSLTTVRHRPKCHFAVQHRLHDATRPVCRRHAGINHIIRPFQPIRPFDPSTIRPFDPSTCCSWLGQDAHAPVKPLIQRARLRFDSSTFLVCKPSPSPSPTEAKWESRPEWRKGGL